MRIVTGVFTALLHGTFSMQRQISYIFTLVTSQVVTWTKIFTKLLIHRERSLPSYVLHIICNYSNNTTTDSVYVCNYSCNNHVTSVTIKETGMKQQQFIRKKKEMEQQVNSGMKLKVRLKWARKLKRPQKENIFSHGKSQSHQNMRGSYAV